MRRRKIMVSAVFEPGRVGVHPLIDAYAQLVPIHQRRTVKGGVSADDKPKPAIWSYRRAHR